MVTSAFLLLSHRYAPSIPQPLTLKNGIIIGLAQAVAVLPGISRSGSTVSTGVFLGLPRGKAFSFSFLLSIPAILGAQLLVLNQLLETPSSDIPIFIMGFISALISGFVAIKVFEKMVKTDTFHYFGYYCFVIGVLVLLLM